MTEVSENLVEACLTKISTMHGPDGEHGEGPTWKEIVEATLETAFSEAAKPVGYVHQHAIDTLRKANGGNRAMLFSHPGLGYVVPIYLGPQAPHPSVQQLAETRHALRLFREFVSYNAKKWGLGTNHHHPIWQLVAETLGDDNTNPIHADDFAKFVKPMEG